MRSCTMDIYTMENINDSLFFLVWMNVYFDGTLNPVPFSVNLNINGAAFLTMVFMLMHAFQPLKF